MCFPLWCEVFCKSDEDLLKPTQDDRPNPSGVSIKGIQ